MKEQLHAHFKKLLSTADKQLRLDDQKISTKINIKRAYPECTVNTGILFDEDGDPIFNIEVASTPVSPDTTAGKARKGKGSKKLVPLSRELWAHLVPDERNQRKQ